jgi:hypothetical protein
MTLKSNSKKKVLNLKIFFILFVKFTLVFFLLLKKQKAKYSKSSCFENRKSGQQQQQQQQKPKIFVTIRNRKKAIIM